MALVQNQTELWQIMLDWRDLVVENICRHQENANAKMFAKRTIRGVQKKSPQMKVFVAKRFGQEGMVLYCHDGLIDTSNGG